MSLNVLCEKNSMRKSHRFDIPMKLHIKNDSYETVDWSMTGVSIKADKNDNFKVDSFYDGVLLLGMADASISLKVKLKCVYFKRDRYGFEFSKFSPKNKKILRRYLELYLDGKIDDIDDLLAIYHEPDIEPVLDLPVKLTDDEKSRLHKSFLRKSIGSIAAFVFLLLVITVVVFYNLRYKYEGVGSIEDNYKNIYANKSGIIKDIYVKDGDEVNKNDILVDLDAQKVLAQIKLLETIKDARLKKFHKSEDKISGKKNSSKLTDDFNILNIKKQIMEEEYKNFQNAKMLLKNHLITKAEMLRFKNVYLDAKESYISLKAKKDDMNDPLKVSDLQELELKIDNKKRELEEYRIFSPYRGTVYEITKKTGDFVDKKDLLFIVWTHKKPKIVCYIPIEKAVEIKVGSKVEIIDSLEQHKFSGVVSRIINSDLKTNMNISATNNLNQALVEILPDDEAKVLSPKSIVKVLFERDFKFGI